MLEGVSLGTRASEAASIDGVWAYGGNFSVSELGRGHMIRNVHKCESGNETQRLTVIS